MLRLLAAYLLPSLSLIPLCLSKLLITPVLPYLFRYYQHPNYGTCYIAQKYLITWNYTGHFISILTVSGVCSQTLLVIYFIHYYKKYDWQQSDSESLSLIYSKFFSYTSIYSEVKISYYATFFIYGVILWNCLCVR